MRKVVLAGFALILCSPTLFAQEGRLVAIADIHGAYDEFVQLLQEVSLIDQDMRWIGGTTTVVQTGDFLDRGKDIRQTMDLLRSLQEQAASAGGEFLILLGNHEAMNLLGFRKDINPEAFAAFATPQSQARQQAESKKFGKCLKQRAKRKKIRAERYGAAEIAEFAKAHPPGYFEYVEAMEADGEYGSWLRSLPMIAVKEHIAFVHGGISPTYSGWSVDELNQRMRQEVDLLDMCRARLLEEGVISSTSDPNEMVSEGLAEVEALTKRIANAPEALRERMVETLKVLEACIGYDEWFLVKSESPIWYRGYARLPKEELLEVVTTGLEGLSVNRFVVGHTPQSSRRVSRKLDGRVFLLDTGMLSRVYEGRGSALEFHQGKVTAIYVGGERTQLEPVEVLAPVSVEEFEAAEPGQDQQRTQGQETQGEVKTTGDQAPTDQSAAPVDRPADGSPSDDPPLLLAATSGFFGGGANGNALVPMLSVAAVPLPSGTLPLSVGSDLLYTDASGNVLPFRSEEALVAFLASGKVKFVGQTETGINRPRRVTVTQGRLSVDAVFRSVDNMERKVRTKYGSVLAYLRDTYRFEPAAYQLNLLLGLDRVPPAVLRTIDGKRGSLQLWMHGMETEQGRLEQGYKPKDSRSWRRQIAEQKLFDRLVGNMDRNQGNLLVNLETEKIWLIDHTRSFVELKTPHELHKVTRCQRDFWESLRSAQKSQVQAMMEPYLLKGELIALWSRWQKLVKRLEGLISEYGEKTIIY